MLWMIISPWLLAAVIAALTLQIVESITLIFTDPGTPEEEAEDERIHRRS